MKHWIFRLFVVVLLSGIVAIPLTLPQYVEAQSCDEIQCSADDDAYLVCIAKKRSCLESKISETQAQKITLNNTIGLINNRVAVQELGIRQSEAEITKLEKEVSELSDRISGLNVSLDRLTTMLIGRIQAQYKQTTVSPILLLVKSDSFPQFFSQFQYLQQAGQHTAEAMGQAETQRIEYDEQRDLKERKQLELENKQRQLESERASLVSQRKEQQYLLDETANNEARYQAELEKTLAEINAIQSIIAGNGDETAAGEVQKGDKIASIIVGASTCSTGTHLHFEVVKDGVNLNPASYLKNIDAQWNNQPDGPFSFGGDWDWPVNNAAKINQGYGMTYYARVRRSYGGAPHTGIDMASKSSDYSVNAVKAGKLFRGSIACGGGRLRYVRVEHTDDGLSTFYLHVNYL